MRLSLLSPHVGHPASDERKPLSNALAAQPPACNNTASAASPRRIAQCCHGSVAMASEHVILGPPAQEHLVLAHLHTCVFASTFAGPLVTGALQAGSSSSSSKQSRSSISASPWSSCIATDRSDLNISVDCSADLFGGKRHRHNSKGGGK